MSLLLPFQLLLWCAILWLLQSTEHGTTIGDSLDEDIFHNSFSTPDLLPLRNVELEQRLNDITSSTFQDRLSFPQSMPSSPSMNEPIINVNKISMSFLTSMQIEFSDGVKKIRLSFGDSKPGSKGRELHLYFNVLSISLFKRRQRTSDSLWRSGIRPFCINCSDPAFSECFLFSYLNHCVFEIVPRIPR